MTVAGYPTKYVAVAAAVAGVVLLVMWFLARRRRAHEPETLPEVLDEGDELHEAETAQEQDVVEMPEPDISGSLLGILSTVRYLRKQKRMARKGYVKWYLMDGSFPTARFVKPSGKGGGIPEVSHGGDTYLMPRDAMVPDANAGAWVCVHKKGEADPVNIRNPGEFAISTDELSEYLTQRVTSSPPGFFENLDISGRDAIMYAIAAVVVFAVLSGGGVL